MLEPDGCTSSSASSAHNAPGTGLPVGAGVGLKHCHYHEALASLTQSTGAPGFFEVHAENYMGDGGPPYHFLELIRRDSTVSIHGVGLSIGASGALDMAHLQRLRILLDRYQPQSFSEHLAWSSHGENFYADLLPLPYDEATLQTVASHVSQVQDYLKRPMLIENPSTYVEFTASAMEEIDFLKELVARTGCGLLLDVNNVHVSCTNHNRDSRAYIDAFPMQAVGEIHLAGYSEDSDEKGAPLLIDAHGCPVFPQVWDLYAYTLARSGPVATLVEWDNDVPEFDVLKAEAARAATMLDTARAQRKQSAA